MVDLVARLEGTAISRRIGTDPRPEVQNCGRYRTRGTEQALHDHRVTHLFYCVQYRDQLARASQVTQIKRCDLSGTGQQLLPVMRFIPGATNVVYRKVAKEADLRIPHVATSISFGPPSLEQALALSHVSLITGGKHYGMHLGPSLYPKYSSHFVEDETPRAPGPNWYYDVEDYIGSHQPSWNWTIFDLPSSSAMPKCTYNLGPRSRVRQLATLRRAPDILWRLRSRRH